MKDRTLPLLLPLLLFPLLLLAGCVRDEALPDTRRGNFEALWQILDQRYCFFAEKRAAYGLDWGEVRERYLPSVSEQMTQAQLFEVLAATLGELRDGHVNLYAPHDVARYAEWYDAYPANYADTLERRYLGRAEEYHSTSGLKYRVLPSGVGYVRCASFDYGLGSGNLHAMMQHLAACPALIVDVRNNGGGLLSAAQKLASLFVNEPRLVGYIRHKTGPAHDALSEPVPIVLDPFEGLRWQKPVCVLTNRRTYSAANSFAMYMHSLPQVRLVGDRTGGGSGLPLSQELPCGWTLRFSACPMLSATGECTEEGIDPDVRQDITSQDYQRGVDTILERAIALLTGSAAPPSETTSDH